MDGARKSKNGKHRIPMNGSTVLHVNGLAVLVGIGEQQRFLGFARNDDTGGRHAALTPFPSERGAGGIGRRVSRQSFSKGEADYECVETTRGISLLRGNRLSPGVVSLVYVDQLLSQPPPYPPPCGRPLP